MPDFDDRRKSQRVEMTERTTINLTVEGKEIPAQLLDISKEGVCLIPDEAIDEGQSISIEHPTAGILEGECVWSYKGSIGVRFGLEESELERVLMCLHLVLDADPSRQAV
ncbi:PilZ domain-containing protein [Rhodovibrionaceae bacterium A322]